MCGRRARQRRRGTWGSLVRRLLALSQKSAGGIKKTRMISDTYYILYIHTDLSHSHTDLFSAPPDGLGSDSGVTRIPSGSFLLGAAANAGAGCGAANKVCGTFRPRTARLPRQAKPSSRPSGW